MVKSPHEALHRIFQKDTLLFARVLERLLKISVPPPGAVSVISTDLTETEPIERRVDTVLMVESESGAYVLAIEAQGEPDPEKLISWCYYIAFLHAKYRCPVTLLVVCLNAATAKWARKPITVGLPGVPSMVVIPLVLGPDNVPAVLDREAASEDVVLSVFSALTHSGSREVAGILEVLAAALDTVDTQTAGFFVEFTETGLGDIEARKIWRALMAAQTYRYQSEYAEMLRAEGRAEGRVEGRVEAVLQLLEERGIPVSPAARDQIISCTDISVAERWFHRAFRVSSVDEIFD